ncbi:MAG: cadmium resistance transporter [Microcoleus vaginatus WJT46-NPBG5]|jgi:cadmium resistance transport/sequestration family protein|nr:cadmium resistance transporter [Microcoleus vaginatus WJT46-NPBG5]
MSELITAIPTGLAAFTATNIDDIVILTLFFAQVNATFRRRHIVIGQYLGFSALLAASLPGFFGSFIVPHAWIKLLGLVPIAIGISTLLASDEEDSPEAEIEIEQSKSSSLAGFLSPQTYSVAAITIANGSDNIGVYVPLFASSEWESLLIILGVFLTMVGAWCYAAYKLTTLPAITQLLTGYGSSLVPCVLIGLGVFIVKESLTLTLLALAASYVWLVTVGRNNEVSPEVEKN